MIGSGRCGQHNVKLVRSITKKKMSNVNKDGTVSWQMREVTILRCPAAQPEGSASKVTAIAPPDLCEMGTNKKMRISVYDDVDQSTPQDNLPEGQQQTPLDRSRNKLQR